MNSLRPCAAFVATVAACGAVVRLVAAPPPIENFTRHPLVQHVSVSEDGRNLIYLNADERSHIGLAGVDLASMAPFSITLEGDDIYDVSWLTNDTVAFNVAMRRRYARGLYTYRLGDKLAAGINERDLTSIVSVVRDDRTRLYVWYRGGASDRQQGLALVDVDRIATAGMGRSNEEFMVVRWVTAPPGELHGWLADWTGQVRLAATFHEARAHVWHRGADQERWEDLSPDWEHSIPLGFSADGRSLYVIHDDGTSDTDALHLYDLTTRTLGPAVFRDPDFALDDADLLVSRRDGSAVGLRYYRDGLATHWMNDRFQKFQAAVNAKLPGRVNHLVSWDEAETRIVVAAQSDRQPRQYYVYQPGKDSVAALPAASPWIDPAQMQPMQTVRFKARDGLALQGFLTLPAKRTDGRKPALVVMPHGGPWVRDSWGWDAQVQFLASRGYAVFQPNYRGSSGFKRDVSGERTDFRAMYEDVADGTGVVARSGLVDADRVAIYGGSFGGYLALAAAAFDPDRFTCAVSFAGVFDWARLVDQARFQRNAAYLRYRRRRDVGDPRSDTERFDEISPIKHAANIKIPLLLVHGAEDRVVEDDQTKALIKVLRQHGIAHETLYFKDEGHGFMNPANETKFLKRLEEFLAKHL